VAKQLSERLADLSVRAQNAVDALTAAKKETQEKLAARKEQARVAATKAAEKVQEEIKAVGDSASSHWNAARAKIAADVDKLKATVARGKHDLDVKHAEHHADRLEQEAGFAIDYAISSVEQAKLAALNALDGRAAAEQAK
jgi:hypothetical protein